MQDRPRTTPRVSIASIAYSEQVGKYRQVGVRLSGESKRR